MSSQRHTGAFIAGSVIGGLVGAAVTLWMTPKSGEELRDSLTGGQEPSRWVFTASGETEEPSRQRFSNPVLGFVERATAPIVGVDLGRLAKDDPEAATRTPVRASSADAQPPATPTTPDAPTSSGEDDISPAEARTYDDDEGSSAHAATTGELTTPTPEYVEELREEEHPNQERDPVDFPDLPSDRRE